jgi:beta-phosphoglucomutase-like phosphatase (HAD superfamily)
MEARFQFSLTAADITQGKPNPEIYLKAARQFDVRPEELLVLEDSQIGCRAAAAARTFAVAVPNGPSLDHDFTAASLVVQSLEDRPLWNALGLNRNG